MLDNIISEVHNIGRLRNPFSPPVISRPFAKRKGTMPSKAKKKSSKQEIWSSLSIRRPTAKLIDELAELITQSENRLQRCTRYEAMHKAVVEMIERLKSNRR